MGDVTGDGWEDVVVADWRRIKVYVNQGLGSFRETEVGFGDVIQVGGEVRQVIIADLDGDGRHDILWRRSDGAVGAVLQEPAVRSGQSRSEIIHAAGG